MVKNLPSSAGNEGVNPRSVHFCRSVVSGSLQPHGLQHARLPCLSPTPGACSNSCPSSWWCHPTISSSAIPFSSHLQSFPVSGSFPNESVLCMHQVAKVLEFQLQQQSLQWIFFLPVNQSFQWISFSSLFSPPEPQLQSLSFYLLFKANYTHTYMSLDSTLLQGKQDVMIIFSFPSHFPYVYKVPWSNTWLVLVCWI